MNADSVAGNDLLYVPRDSADITLKDPGKWSAVNAFIDGEACLREQRGRIVARNSCRNPAFITLDARLAKSITFGDVQRLEVGLDVFNVGNLIDHDWGLVRSTTPKRDTWLPDGIRVGRVGQPSDSGREPSGAQASGCQCLAVEDPARDAILAAIGPSAALRAGR